MNLHSLGCKFDFVLIDSYHLGSVGSLYSDFILREFWSPSMIAECIYMDIYTYMVHAYTDIPCFSSFMKCYFAFRKDLH